MKQFKEPRYNRAGKPICEICNKGFSKVTSHAVQAHGISAKEYKLKFGYDPRKGIVSREFRNHLKDQFHQNYDQHLEQLKKAGRKTQFKKGNQAAKGVKKKVERTLTVQEMIAKISKSGLKRQKNHLINNSNQ